MIYKQFYSELGKLLYSIADADGVITEKEKQTLLSIVKKELVPAEEHRDEFGTNAAYYAEIEFEIMNEEIASPEDAFNSFIGFVEEHRESMDANIKNACIRITTELAKASYGINGKEREQIEKLRTALEKIEFGQGAGVPKKKKRPRISSNKVQIN